MSQRYQKKKKLSKLGPFLIFSWISCFDLGPKFISKVPELTSPIMDDTKRVFCCFVFLAFITVNVSRPLWAADILNESTCAVPPLILCLLPPLPLLRFFCFPLSQTTQLLAEVANRAQHGEMRRGGGVSPRSEEIILRILGRAPIMALGLFKVFWLQANHQKATFSEFPQNSHSRRISPLPSLHTPHQAGFELSERFVIMSTKSTPTFTNYQHGQVTLSSYVKGDVSFTRQGTLQIYSFFFGQEQWCEVLLKLLLFMTK